MTIDAIPDAARRAGRALGVLTECLDASPVTKAFLLRDRIAAACRHTDIDGRPSDPLEIHTILAGAPLPFPNRNFGGRSVALQYFEEFTGSSLIDDEFDMGAARRASLSDTGRLPEIHRFVGWAMDALDSLSSGSNGRSGGNSAGSSSSRPSGGYGGQTGQPRKYTLFGIAEVVEGALSGSSEIFYPTIIRAAIPPCGMQDPLGRRGDYRCRRPGE